jgi:hypothetical protein
MRVFLALEIGIFETLIDPVGFGVLDALGYFTMIILLEQPNIHMNCALWIPKKETTTTLETEE